MRLHGGTQTAGSLAVNDRHLMHARHGSAVQEAVHVEDAFLHHLTAQIDLHRAASRGGKLLRYIAGTGAGILFLLFRLGKAQIFLRDPHPDDPRLHQHRPFPVRRHLQHGGFLVDVVDQHRIPGAQRTGQNVLPFLLTAAADGF